MDFVLFDRPRFNALYNCSFYDVDSIPVEKRQHVVLGSACIAFFFLFELLYLPCLWAISRLPIEQTVIKLMFILGLSDTCGLLGSGFFVGFFTVRGSVFCSSPTLVLVAGMFAMFCWAVGSVTNVLLALNRCIQIHNPVLAQTIFEGRKATRFWIPLIVAYGLVGMLGSKPVFFNSIYMVGFFNPHQGYFEDREGVYHNYLHTANNFFVVIGILTMYIAFFSGLAFRHRMQSGSGMPVRRLQRHEISSFCQILVIASLEVSTCLIYIYVQFFEASQLVYYLGTFTFLFRQGCPAIIYLVANRSIRKVLANALGLRAHAVKSIGLHSTNSDFKHGAPSAIRPTTDFH